MSSLGRLELQIGANNSELLRRLRESETIARDSGQRTGFSFREAIIQGIGIDLGRRITDTVFGSVVSTASKVQGFIKSSLGIYQAF